MQWYNEPEDWQANGKNIRMFVTPRSDYWRISHYGFTVDDAPFYYGEYGGEFEVTVKVSGKYKTRFDQAGIMIRLDHENYIKAGIEYVDGYHNLSVVVTHHTSDWSVIRLDDAPESIYIRAIRRLDAIQVYYSIDGKDYIMMRNAWMQDNHPLRVGVMGASPDGNGFEACFEDFKVRHLPDLRRQRWLENEK